MSEVIDIIKSVVGEIAGSVVGRISEGVVAYVLSPVVFEWIIDEFSGLVEQASSQPTVPGENYITPSVALQNVAELVSFAARLAAVNPELGELISEGLGEDLINALQHVTSEPLERLFSVKFGAENIDSDDLSESYGWVMMPPQMYAWLVAVAGLSNSAALASFLKALGEKYSGDFRAIEDAAGSVAAKTITISLDPMDKLYSEIRSAVFGLPEATRTATNDIVSEVNRLYATALRRSMEALAYYKAARRIGDAKAQQMYEKRAELKLAEAEGFLEAADELARLMRGYEALIEDKARAIASELVAEYENTRRLYASLLAEALSSATELVIDVQSDIKNELDMFAVALQDIRGATPNVNIAEPRAVKPAPSIELEILEVG